MWIYFEVVQQNKRGLSCQPLQNMGFQCASLVNHNVCWKLQL